MGYFAKGTLCERDILLPVIILRSGHFANEPLKRITKQVNLYLTY